MAQSVHDRVVAILAEQELMNVSEVDLEATLEKLDGCGAGCGDHENGSSGRLGDSQGEECRRALVVVGPIVDVRIGQGYGERCVARSGSNTGVFDS